MVNVKKVNAELAKLGVLKFYPQSPEAQAAIVQLVCEMVTDLEQVKWLVKRTLSLYNEWPGPREFRACFCSRFRPRDGINAYSEVYADGIPSERAPEPLPALPPGATVSAAPSLEAAVRDLAAMKSMSAPRRLPAPVVPIERPDFKPITQADIDRAVAENRRKGEGAMK